MQFGWGGARCGVCLRQGFCSAAGQAGEEGGGGAQGPGQLALRTHCYAAQLLTPNFRPQVEVTFPQKGNKKVVCQQGDPLGKVCSKAGVRLQERAVRHLPGAAERALRRQNLPGRDRAGRRDEEARDHARQPLTTESFDVSYARRDGARITRIFMSN